MGAMSKSSEAYVALGPDALLKRLAATAIELQEIKMDNPFPRDPMLGSMSIMEFGDPTSERPIGSVKARLPPRQSTVLAWRPLYKSGHPCLWSSKDKWLTLSDRE